MVCRTWRFCYARPPAAADASVTFKEIGGHEEEERAASEAWERALCRQSRGMAMCRNVLGRSHTELRK
jgi:hypothetical protein